MVIVDTGFWLALANNRDRFHDKAINVLENLSESLITTWPVLTETCHLLLNQLGHPALENFLHMFSQGAFSTFPLTDEHASRIEKLIKKYKDLPMDLADASLVILAEELGQGRILSTDLRDFHTYRWKQHKPFKNLLIEN